MGNLKLKDCLIEDQNTSDLQSYKGPEGEIPVQDILHISDEALDKYYEVSCKILHDKRYKDAVCAFTFLCFLTPLYSSFWLGLGISEQLQEHYDEAADAYLKAIETSPDDPVPYANLAQCFLALNEKKAAELTIEKTLELCADHLNYTSIKEKVLALQDRAGLKKKSS